MEDDYKKYYLTRNTPDGVVNIGFVITTALSKYNAVLREYFDMNKKYPSICVKKWGPMGWKNDYHDNIIMS